MFLIRRAKIEDVPTLVKLARMVHFINLPADKDIITEKVMRSRESFIKAAALAAGSGHSGSADTLSVVTEGRAESGTPVPNASMAPNAPGQKGGGNGGGSGGGRPSGSPCMTG